MGNQDNYLFTMPGYLSDEKFGGLGCKMFTVFPGNFKKNKPELMANVFLLDEEDGSLKAVIDAALLTEWRTAAASAVATRFIHGGNNKILAILGAGAQGRAHALAFEHLFKFDEIRIWNRTMGRAKSLVDERNSGRSKDLFVAYNSIEECVKDTDVIITATSGNDTILRLNWLKEGVHINAVRVNPVHRELEDAIYRSSEVYIDYLEGAMNELERIRRLGVEFKGQVGMAVEDCAATRMVYDLHIEKISELKTSN